MTQTPNRPQIIDMPISATSIGFQDSKQSKPKILQGIYDLPIRTKQLISLCIAQVVSVVGLAGGGALLNQDQGRKQLESQAKSELAVVEINYNIKINQMGFGFRGQSDNIDIIATAKAAKQGLAVPESLKAQVSRILKNEVKARKIEYATLVGKDLKILVSANANRQGETFDPNGLVSKVLKSPDPQIRSSEVVSWEELKKENPPLPKGFTDQDALIRYTFTQVKDPVTGEVIGALVSGDIVNNKLPIVEGTLKAFGGGFSAVYFQKPSGDLALATSLNAPKGQALSEESQKVNQPLADLSVLQSAIAANGSPVTQRFNQGGVNSTVASKALLNSQGQPVALLVKGTPETELEALTASNLLLLLVVILVVLAINVFLAFILGDAIASPIKKLQDNAQRFSEGERDVRTEIFAADEVGQLTLVFNQMADQLRDVLDIQEAEVDRVDLARQEARQEAEIATQEQRQQKELLQKRALELLMEVDPISRGDLTIRAKVTEDEIGTVADSYNATIESLRRIVTQVQAAAKLMTDTTTSSESSVLDLSKEAVRQSEEIASALDRIQEMSQSTRTVTASAQTAEGLVKQSTISLKEGDSAMNLTVDGILAIRSTVAETSKKVKRLGESSQKISKVVNLISSFAEQTNLLALNAAIEAARAGEEGRGFGVVADRVRSLAKQSTNASREIEVLVAEIQSETNEVVTAMEVGTEQVVIGTRLVEDARQNLNKIAEASSQINTLVETIAQASLAQSKASEIVTETITDVAAIALNTSTEANQVSTTFKDLLKISQELQKSVGQFKV